MSKSQYLDLVRKAIVFSMPLLIAQVYFKYTYLRYGGMEILERATNTSNIGLTQYLSLYSLDVVETPVLVPFILILIGLIVSKSRTVLFQIITGLLLLAGVISWTSYHVIGSFPNQSLARDNFQILLSLIYSIR